MGGRAFANKRFSYKSLSATDNSVVSRERAQIAGMAEPEMEALDHARSLLRQRRIRDAAFPPGLFGEPAWDALLTLYIARCEGRRLSRAGLCLSLNLPPARSANWISALEASRLIEKVRLPDQSETPGICISDTGFHRVTMLMLDQEESVSN